MFKINLFSVLLLCTVTIQAQTPLTNPTCDECKAAGLSYPYYYCDQNSNGYKFECRQSPFGPGKKPWKLCLPLVSNTIYNDKELTDEGIGTLQYWDKDGITLLTAFNYNAAFNIANEEIARWLNICQPFQRDDNCQSCPIVIKWSSDANDFGDLLKDPAVTSLYSYSQTGGGTLCEADCSGTYILLNCTSTYTNKDPSTKYPKNFFYTSPTEPIWGAAYSSHKYRSFRFTISHELGHLFGFDHSTKCGVPFSIMDPGADNTMQMTGYDVCMFKLLYCCDEQANNVEEIPSINSDFHIYPNPTFSDVTISLSASAAQYPKRLRVVDINGKTVLEQAFTTGSSDCLVKTNGLSKGAYLFVISFDGINGSYAEKVIIQ